MYKNIIIAVVCLIASTGIAAEKPSVSELLKRHTTTQATTQDKFKSFIMKGEDSVEYSMNVRLTGPIPTRADNEKFYHLWEGRSDGKRVTIRAHMWGNPSVAGGYIPKSKPSYRSHTWDGQQFWGYSRGGDSAGIAKINKKQDEWRRKSLIGGHGGSWALGYFGVSEEPAGIVLREARSISVRDETEKINGVDCFVIDADTKCGKYKVWIDPEHGYNIAKAQVELREGKNYLFHGRPFDTAGAKLSFSMENVRFEKIDDVWIPVEADTRFHRLFHSGKSYFSESKAHLKITDIILNPDHDALGSFLPDDIKNGARVRIVGVEGIAYRWQDGELIPNIDEAVIDEIDKMAEEIMAETIRTKSTIAPMVATISDLLKKYAETQDKLRSFIAKGESTIEYIKIPRQSGRMQKELCEFRTDGDRVNHRGSVWDKLLSKDKALYKSLLWDGESFIQYRQGSQLTDSTVFIEKNDDGKKRMIATEYKGAPLMGICGGDYDRIDSILRKADNISLRQKTEQVGNSQCYVIDAVTKRGKYMVWIDPEHGYNIAKIELQKRKGDLIGSSERVEIGMLFLLKNVRFEKTDDVWVPVEADMKQYQDDRISIIKWHHKRTKMTLNPDHNALGSFVPDDIPEGTKVSVSGEYGREYIWQNGKVVSEDGGDVKF